MYHIAAIDRGENVRLSEDFFIEARKDSPPTVKIDRPGRDAKVNPIEEVTVAVNAEDDFGLNEVEPALFRQRRRRRKPFRCCRQKGVKTADGKYVYRARRLQAGAGRSGQHLRRPPRTRATPPRPTCTSSRPSRSNAIIRSRKQAAAAAAWAAATTQQQISQRQKDIIAATWNELQEWLQGPSIAADDAKFLAEQEDKLAAQAKSLADRMKARELADANPQFQNFAKEMEEASKSMIESAQKIRAQKWNDAMPAEQKALQARAARRSHLPRYPGGVRNAGRRRWSGRRGPRSRKPGRPGTRPRKEPVRNRPAVRFR